MLQTQSKTLLAGPWVGEFGWELFCWQGYVRKLSRRFDRTIIIGRPTNGFLYEDFCDEYIPFDPESFRTDAWNCHGAKSANHIIKEIPHDHYLSGHFDIGMRYSINGVSDTKGLFFTEQEYHKYNKELEHEGYDVIFHCRNKSTGADRNWSKEQWDKLFELLPDDLVMACVGNDEAFHIEGTDDLRGLNLETLVGIMNNSDLMVGPSSGPMHLASLCGLKHLVWSTDYNKVRYQLDWNPFNTEVIFYGGGGFNPKANIIKDLILKNI